MMSAVRTDRSNLFLYRRSPMTRGVHNSKSPQRDIFEAWLAWIENGWTDVDIGPLYVRILVAKIGNNCRGTLLIDCRSPSHGRSQTSVRLPICEPFPVLIGVAQIRPSPIA